MVKLLIYEDNPQFREGLCMLLNGTDGFEVLSAYKNCNNIEEEIGKWNPDVVLMDIDMPGTNGIDGLKTLRNINATVKVLMLTVFDDNKRVFDAISSGANGYLLKNTPPLKLIEYIQEAHTGGAPMTSSIATQVLKMFSASGKSIPKDYNLTARENELLQLLVNGYSYKIIAAKMNIALDTVRSHIRNIYDKLHVSSGSEAVAKALKEKII